MNTMHTMILLTTALTAQEAEQAPSVLPQFMPIIIMFIIFYVVLIAPQRREAKERDKMREELKKGDEVVTAGGIHGQVLGGDKHTVTIRVAPKVELVIDRVAVARLEKKADGVVVAASASDDAGKATARSGEVRK